MAVTRKSSLQILAVGIMIMMIAIMWRVEGGAELEVGMFGSGRDVVVGECLDELEVVQQMRRILAQTQYISYGALNKNRVPCSRRGASYYNCQPAAAANPYTRGCSAITHCTRTNS